MSDINTVATWLVQNKNLAETPEYKQMAEAFRRMDQGGSVGESTLMAGAPQTAPSPTMGQRAVGVLDFAATMGATTATDIAAGLYSIPDLVRFFISGDDDALAESVNKQESIQGLAYSPRSQEGKRYVQAVGDFFAPYEEWAQSRGTAAMEEMGRIDTTGENVMARRIAGATDYTGAMMLPSLLGLPGMARRAGARTTGLDTIRRAEENTGIQTRATGTEQASQIVGATSRLTGNRTVRGQGFEGIQESVMAARLANKNFVTTLYDQAKNTNAAIPARELDRLPDLMRTSLDGYDLDVFPIVQARMNEINTFIANLPDNASVRLNAISRFRSRLNRTRPATTDLAQNTALNIMKGQIDSFVDAAFNADMISGDPAAVARWKSARAAHADYKERFSANKVIRQLSEQETGPEQIKRWILNSSATGAPAEAGMVVGRLKEILGEDSPEFTSLRQEVMFDLVEPLLSETPNIPQFILRHDRWFRDHPSLANQIFPESTNALTDLRNMVKGVSNVRGIEFDIDLSRTASRFLFGNALAKNATTIGVTTQAFRTMRNLALEPSRQRQIMADILGYDPLAPIIRPRNLAAPGLPVSALQAQEELNQLYGEGR
jgi:hypothetical protein